MDYLVHPDQLGIAGRRVCWSSFCTVNNESIDQGRCCLLFVGAPGAGKSTLSMAVARRLSRAARLRAEDLHMLIVTGGVWALGEPHHEAEAQVDLTMRNLAALARNFADAGFAPVVDALFDTADRLAIFREAFGQRLRFIVLDVDEHTCRRRNASRPAIEQFAFGDYAGLRAGMQKAFGDQGWWLNTGAQTIDESVDLVLAGADDRARVS